MRTAISFGGDQDVNATVTGPLVGRSFAIGYTKDAFALLYFGYILWLPKRQIKQGPICFKATRAIPKILINVSCFLSKPTCGKAFIVRLVR